MDNPSSLLPSSLCHQRGQWQASFKQEKSACLTEVSVTEQTFQIPKFSEILGELSMCKQCVSSSLSLPTHKRLTPRLIIAASQYQLYRKVLIIRPWAGHLSAC